MIQIIVKKKIIMKEYDEEYEEFKKVNVNVKFVIKQMNVPNYGKHGNLLIELKKYYIHQFKI